MHPLIEIQREGIARLCRQYGVDRLDAFGSVLREDFDAEHSDIDLLVDLEPGGGNELLRVAGIAEELSDALGTRVDVVAASLLRPGVSSTALHDAVPL